MKTAILYFLVMFANDGNEYVVDGPMPVEDCIYAMLDLSDSDPDELAYACEQAKLVESE